MMRWLLAPLLAAVCFLPAFPECLSSSEETGRGEGKEQQQRPPNLVIVLADDLGIGDPGCYNPQSGIATPYIDKLATQGMRFNDMHSPSAVCSPTRYGMLTGRYCWRTSLKKSVCFGYDPLLIELGRLTLASLLKQWNYITAAIGKWHLGLGGEKKADYSKVLKPGPNQIGFDYFLGFPAALDMQPYVIVENDRALAAPTAFMPASQSQRQGGPGFWEAGPCAPGFKHEEVQPLFTAKAVEFIGKQKKDKPFFLYFPLTAVHHPWLPTKEFRGKSKAGPYGDFVQQMDATLGQIMKALDDGGHSDNTLIIFASDNGAEWLPEEIKLFKHKANMDWRGMKGDIWEGGHRVPFIARWPGKIKAGATSDETLCLVDVLATTAAVVGAKLPNDAAEDSFNFLPILLGEKPAQPIRDFMIYHSFDGSYGIRQGPWMLTPILGSGGFTQPAQVPPVAGGPQGQLYNLKDDPRQTKNLWLAQSDQVRRLTALLEKAIKDGRTRPGPKGP
ncbi:MAG TPA: arylsulfatase [Gemmataceae bacterium]|nr:arylsulfatase [Gemmataceae bacterium]